jgi:hypothetical protein
MRSLAIALSIAFLGSTVFTTAALASRMNGKGNCTGGVCTGGGTLWSSGANRGSTTGATKTTKATKTKPAN